MNRCYYVPQSYSWEVTENINKNRSDTGPTSLCAAQISGAFLAGTGGSDGDFTQ